MDFLDYWWMLVVQSAVLHCRYKAEQSGSWGRCVYPTLNLICPSGSLKSCYSHHQLVRYNNMIDVK